MVGSGETQHDAERVNNWITTGSLWLHGRGLGARCSARGIAVERRDARIRAVCGEGTVHLYEVLRCIRAHRWRYFYVRS